MSTRARTVDGKKVDARSERWREHRRKVRDQFVDAAFVALDASGPEVSMGDIARAAGAAKPKLYRHFEDKTDLYAAIAERMRDLLWERVVAGADLDSDTTGELIRRGVTAYVTVVTEHPNVFRFVMHSHVTRKADDAARVSRIARRAARRAADLFAGVLHVDAVDADSVELVNYSIFGAVAAATDWWLGAERANAGMPVEAFVAYLTEIVTALVRANARLSGVVVDVDAPLRTALRRLDDTASTV